MNVATVDQMRQLKEDALRQEIIMPLLEKLGYRGVFEWHGGSSELGKDIVGWKENDLGNRRNRAVVAKATNISGTRAVSEVVAQVAQAFNSSFEDHLSGTEQRVHEVWVVTNKKLGKEARKLIRSSLPPEKEPYVEILDGNDLWREVKKHLPVEIFQVLDDAQRLLVDATTKFGTAVELNHMGQRFASIEVDGRRVSLVERYPGQLEDDPFVIGMKARFPQTPEGSVKRKEFERAMATGATVKLPGEYFSLDIPEALESVAEQFFGIKPGDWADLEISSIASPKQVPVRIEFNSDEGHSAVFEYIELKVVQAGTQEITLTNDEQPIPIRYSQVIDLRNRSARFTIGQREEPIAAPVLRRLLEAMRIFSGPCTIRGISVENGLTLWSSRKEDATELVFEEEWEEVVRNLAVVQEQTSVPIYIPRRAFTNEEINTIRQIQSIVRAHEQRGTWDTFTVTFGASDAEAALELLAQEKGGRLRLEREEELVLFGSLIPLGRVSYVFEGGTLVNSQEVREKLDCNSAADEEIEFHLEPGGDNRVSWRYLDWASCGAGSEGVE